MKRNYMMAKCPDTWFQLPPEVRMSYKNRLIKRYSSICTKGNGSGCGGHFPLHLLSVDHIIPISLGGPVCDIHNMQLLCFRCHERKTKRIDSKAKTFEFIGSHYLAI